jgi:uncharacterized membrane protein YfcA
VNIELALIGFAFIVFAGYAVQTVTGFGSMLVCVTLGAHLLDIRELITLAVPISILQTAYIAIRHRKTIDYRLLLRRILPLMGIGLGVGYFAFRDTESSWLRIAFAVMVLVLAVRELWVLRKGKGEPRKNPPAASIAAMIGAGVIHGIYATGGPLLVYAVGREGLDKHAFRSTLSAVWLVLNIALVTGFLFDGRYDVATSYDLLVLLPAVPLGIAVGEWLHRRVDEVRFKTTVFILLILAAISLLAR